MVKSVNSAFFSRLQDDSVNIVELIDLSHQGIDYRWTSDAQDLVSSGNTYSSFQGENIDYGEQTTDLSVAISNFMFSNSSDSFSSLLKASNFDAADMVVSRVFPDTPDLGRLEIIRGKIGDISFDRNKIDAQVRNEWGSAEQEWPRYSYKDICTLRFGSTPCGVDTSSYTLVFSSSDVSTADAIQITMVTSTLVQSYANGYFDYGRVTFTDGLNSGEVRTVRNHSGDVIDLSHSLPYNASSDAFDLFPGCRKRLIDDCTSRYNNQANYLGFNWIPIMEDRGTSDTSNNPKVAGAGAADSPDTKVQA